ncbi:hypothetical protein [Microbacterium hydrocarbonoxydans]|uniref:Uncharacterized protein n=1 Tax=Microbacterium hydrocarbonoxydans TaxID=273678 RepID=A0A1H4MK85_9MICO|nr:hypothetical protein [Microbacterium hydrocarbonoxydans]SEB82955.1 hypothetical protein SAMN04489807_2161 [Microbacterium hydrocarbonoxydans]
MTKRLAIILASALGALVIVATVVIVLVVNGLNASTQEADYRACLASKGIYDTSDTSDMADMAASCYEAVYGRTP